MQAQTRVRWQAFVDMFGLDLLPGLKPWDAQLADELRGLSNGEAHVVRFLLRVWDPNTEWASGPFDVVEALACWDEQRSAAFAFWAADPWWP